MILDVDALLFSGIRSIVMKDLAVLQFISGPIMYVGPSFSSI